MFGSTKPQVSHSFFHTGMECHIYGDNKPKILSGQLKFRVSRKQASNVDGLSEKLPQD